MGVVEGQALLDLNRLVARRGQAAIFFVVLLENLGLPAPEEAVLGLAGSLIWTGDLRLPTVFAIGILTAVVGDTIGCWIGRREGAPVRAVLAVGPEQAGAFGLRILACAVANLR